MGLQELDACHDICEVLVITREWPRYFPKTTLQLHAIYKASKHAYLLRVAIIYTAASFLTNTQAKVKAWHNYCTTAQSMKLQNLYYSIKEAVAHNYDWQVVCLTF